MLVCTHARHCQPGMECRECLVMAAQHCLPSVNNTPGFGGGCPSTTLCSPRETTDLGTQDGNPFLPLPLSAVKIQHSCPEALRRRAVWLWL